MYRTFFLSAIIAGTLSANASPGARLLRQPDISREKIAFIYAGDLWTVPRTGGTARRLTATPEAESFPKFSPDGNSIAFNRQGDIYVIPATGGDERRLTWHQRKTGSPAGHPTAESCSCTRTGCVEL